MVSGYGLLIELLGQDALAAVMVGALISVSRARLSLGPGAMIAIVGQSVVDRVREEGREPVERLGGSPVFAAAALAFAGHDAVILTKGGTPALRAPLGHFGFAVVVGEATSSFVSALDIYGDGERHHEIAASAIRSRPPT